MTEVVTKKKAAKKVIQCNPNVNMPPDKNVAETGRDLKNVDGRYVGIDFDAYVASYYNAKFMSCKQANREWGLTLSEVRVMLSTKKCQMTGVELTHRHAGINKNRPSDVTLDRLDNSKGYVKGNVMAVCWSVNQAKSYFEAYFKHDSSIAAIHAVSKALTKRGLK